MELEPRVAGALRVRRGEGWHARSASVRCGHEACRAVDGEEARARIDEEGEGANVAPETRPLRSFKWCSGCKVVKYCSEACQNAAWKRGHKEVCARAKVVRETLATHRKERRRRAAE